MRRFILAAISLASAALADLSAQSVDSPFAVVFIDDRTEAQLGPFPYDRGVLAEGLERLRQAEAKGVVLKFFLDQRKSMTGDARLAAAIKSIPTALQARILDSEKKANELPQRFVISAVDVTRGEYLSGRSGWLPLPEFAAAAEAVGFVDQVDVSRVPLLESYQKRAVKGLHLCALEMAFGERARIGVGGEVTLNGRKASLDRRRQAAVETPKALRLTPVSFVDLLRKDDALRRLKGKVVVLGYDGARMPQVETSSGKMKKHRLFVAQLLALHGRFSSGQSDEERE